MTIDIKLDEGAYMPERAHATDAGYDLRSMNDTYVWAGSAYNFDTGVHMAIPAGYVGQITSKSGLMRDGLTSRGTIDAGYTGSIHVILFNSGKEAYKIRKGDKISQILITPIITPELRVVDMLDETERGDNGFGSTGK